MGKELGWSFGTVFECDVLGEVEVEGSGLGC